MRWRNAAMMLLLCGGCVLQPPAPAPATLVSAHRGGAAYAPENTLMAFANAARLGADDFETDAWLSADGVAVLIHDARLDRTSNCQGPVSERLYVELRACDAGYWFSPGQSVTLPDPERAHPARGLGLQLPTAQQLLDYVGGFRGAYRPTLTIEIKDQRRPLELAAVLVRLVQRSDLRERVVLESFNLAALQRVKQLDARIRTLYLVDVEPGAEAGLQAAIDGGHEIVSPAARLIDGQPDYVRRVHEAGKQLVLWTVDREPATARLMALGVDGLISNYPGCALHIQGRLPAQPLLPEALRGSGDVSLCQP